MDEQTSARRGYSRRDFLKGLPIGVAGALAFSIVLNRLLPSFLARRRRPPVFPKGSIFTPSIDSQRDV